MKILLSALGAGWIFYGLYRLIAKEDAAARHKAWMIDHDRRCWREGVDLPKINWSAMKRRHLDGPRYNVRKRA